MVKQEGWEITTNRFVAYLDIMGFKDMILQHGHEYALDKIQTVRNAVKMLTGGGFLSFPNLKSVQFSDSIFIFSETDTSTNLAQLLTVCTVFLRVCCGEKIPLKGAISFGKITTDFNNSIFVGQPIINAYLLHDELHMFGIILDHNTENKMIEFTKTNITDEGDKIIIERELIKYKTPTKNGKINHYCLAWPEITLEFPNGDGFEYRLMPNIIASIDKFYSTVSGKSRLYIDNTLEFVEYLVKVTKDKHPGITEFVIKK